MNAIKASSLGLILLCMGGCLHGQITDPNTGPEAPQHIDVLRRNMQDAWDSLELRVRRDEISRQDQRKLYTEFAKELAKKLSPRVSPEDAWAYGDVYRDAEDWPNAYKFYNVARKAAETNDRKVNDSLRFAVAAAQLGKIDEAISAAKSTFEVDAQDKGPILPAILLQLIPVARNKGKDLELAKLLEGAIRQHRDTIVDPKTDAGKAFIAAKAFHINQAWSAVISLYNAAGKPGEARRAIDAFQSERTSRAQV